MIRQSDQPPPPRRRLGRFIVGHATFASDWHALLPLFAKVVPVRAESLFHLAGIEYLALCEDFDEIDLQDTPPLYDVAYRQVDGRDAFFFVRHATVDTHDPGLVDS